MLGPFPKACYFADWLNAPNETVFLNLVVQQVALAAFSLATAYHVCLVFGSYILLS